MSSDFMFPPVDRADQDELTARYGKIWESSRPGLTENRVSIDPLPKQGDPRWGVSLVFRPEIPPDVWTRLQGLAALAGPDHSYYAQHNVHITIRTVERYRPDVSADEPALRQYIEATRAALARCPRFDIEFRGIVAAKTSILLCGYPQFDLQGLRRGLHKNLTELGFTSDSPEPDIADVRNTCHASLAVFGGLLSNPAGFADLIDRFQHLDFGTGPCGDTEIVSFARTGNNIAINRLCSA